MPLPSPPRCTLVGYFIPNINENIRSGDNICFTPEASSSAAEAVSIGRVMKITKEPGSDQARVHVRLFCAPIEFNEDGKKFIGLKELFLIDQYDVINSDKICGKCKVHTLEKYKKLEVVQPEDYYYRFEIERATRLYIPPTVDIFCSCKQPENPDLFMIDCAVCGERYHPDCVGMTDHEARALDHFVCQECQ